MATPASPVKPTGIGADEPFPLTDVGRWVLSQTDEEFHKHGWEELKDIIQTNKLDTLKRKPSDLRAYMAWTADIKVQYGSMTSYILANRLPKSWGLPPMSPTSSIPFHDSSDYRVLLNDWPYGLDPDITHIVVWSRTAIPTEPSNGDLTPESRQQIEEFVDRYFIQSLGKDGKGRVLWFKNWVALQSVRALEHFHVLVKGVGDNMLEQWTGERPKR